MSSPGRGGVMRDARWRLLRALRPITTRTRHSEGLACRILTPRLLASGRGRDTAGRVNGTMFDLALSDYVETKAWIVGHHAPEILEFCIDNLPPGGIAVDVGANVGFISVPLARHARAIGARVVAVEPLPRNIERLRRHMARSGVESTAEVVACAAGAAPGTAEIRVEPRLGFTSNGTIGAEPRSADRISPHASVVAMETLDAICDVRGIDVIDVIKIDVEGFEPAVLQGAAALLGRRAIRSGVLEINEPLLRSHGWSRRRVLELLHEHDLEPRPLAPGGDIETDCDIAFRASGG